MADDLDIYEKQGFGNRIGFGEKPALIVIDFINAFNDPEMFGGGSIQSAIDHTEELLGLARHLDLPVAFTHPRLRHRPQRGRDLQHEVAGAEQARPQHPRDRDRRPAARAPGPASG